MFFGPPIRIIRNFVDSIVQHSAPNNRTGRCLAGRAMAITKEQKRGIIESFKRDPEDTGSPEVQIALLTSRINDLTDHFKVHKKDHASRRGLLMLVSKRSSLLKYLRLNSRKSYLEVINRLGLRK